MTFSSFNYFDYALAIIIFISVIWGLKRGVIRELISLLTWVAAFYAAMTFAPLFVNTAEKFVKDPVMATVVSFALIFLAVLIIGMLLNFIVSTLFNFTSLGFLNRLLGGAFGFVRGGLISLFIIMAITHSAWQQTEWFQQAVLTAHFQNAATWVQQQFNLPAAVTADDKK